MLSNTAKHYQRPTNYQTQQNIIQQNITENSKTLANSAKHYQTQQNIIELSETLLNAAKHYRLQQNIIKTQQKNTEDTPTNYQRLSKIVSHKSLSKTAKNIEQPNIIRHTAKHNFPVQNMYAQKFLHTHETLLAVKSLFLSADWAQAQADLESVCRVDWGLGNLASSFLAQIVNCDWGLQLQGHGWTLEKWWRTPQFPFQKH